MCNATTTETLCIQAQRLKRWTDFLINVGWEYKLHKVVKSYVLNINLKLFLTFLTNYYLAISFSKSSIQLSRLPFVEISSSRVSYQSYYHFQCRKNKLGLEGFRNIAQHHWKSIGSNQQTFISLRKLWLTVKCCHDVHIFNGAKKILWVKRGSWNTKALKIYFQRQIFFVRRLFYFPPQIG